MAQTSASHISPANLAHYLTEDLKADARQNQASTEILQNIDEPEDTNRAMAEVNKARRPSRIEFD